MLLKRLYGKVKVGIIGCGAMGSQIALALRKNFPNEAVLAYLCDELPEKALKLKRKLRQPVEIVSLRDLVKKSEMVIEAASQQAATEVIDRVGSKDKMVLIMSVGGVLNAKRVSLESFRNNRARYWIPSGAVAGIDGLLAAREGGIKSVLLITKKPPGSLRGARYFQKRPFPSLRANKKYCVFRGSAAEAVMAFPQNVNVAAILSFAGIGARKTSVQVWTSNAFKKNQHEIKIEYKTGKINIQVENDPLPENPKTSALSVYAAIALLRRIFSSFRIGT